MKSTYAAGVLAAGISLFWIAEISGFKLNKLLSVLILVLSFFFTFATYTITIPDESTVDFSQAYISGLEFESNITFFAFYLTFLFAVLLAVIILIVIGYRRAKDEIRRKQIRLVLIGLVFSAGSIILADIFFPLMGLYRYSPYLDSPSSLFLLFFSALAIARYQLFSVRVILTEILVIFIGILLFLLPFLVTIWQLQITTAVIFLVFCLFGYLLIRSSLRELNQKEQLEREVKERTKELEHAKNLAEERANELERAKNLAEKNTLELRNRTDLKNQAK